MTAEVALKPKDYASAQDVRWCPGCGNYSVIKAVQKTLAEAGCNPENTVFVSGIGCSSRFPYYMETYGFHTIHGRAAAVATGVKISKPELDVWVVSGDGDSLAIGGNHLLHLLRRNVDVTYLLLNNEIYGLTKGQASPTSRRGTLSPTSPHGTLDQPVNPIEFAIGAHGRFIARCVDALQNLLSETFARAHAFHGTSFVEILQNCLVFNDGVFSDQEDKKKIDDTLLWLHHGEPMLYGADKSKGILFNPKTYALEPVTIGLDGVTLDDIVVHDETSHGLAMMLSALEAPLPVGVIYAAPEATFIGRQPIPQGTMAKSAARLAGAMHAGNTWRVE
ncbi:2-oxoacid:ferredoxin oxidoreductase subunit beta [Rhodobium gokarnense]|uniref:2-oxoglutarate ferredoxin oxidoreductase subunit beta n=1 Tax=Rhodobium gokarnense TaxID=364296 RepID=A0ABT3H8V0_9HYPH|nr:2-oxoacid:ferredoxin oxidoreductase subunit beta [Rhodobium gokarnense]MCW2306813.1 2-oxoglutarate ferredoxin oxidoreductase subunit beta [Rhodobium gokarnense]